MTTTFYSSRDNTYSLSLTNNGSPYSLSTTTLVTLKWYSGAIDSLNNPDAISFDDSEISLNLGMADLDPGIYQMALILFDPLHPDGIVWDDHLSFKIVSV